MEIKRILRMSIFLQWIFFIMSIVARFIEKKFLSPTLINCLEEIVNKQITIFYKIIMVVGFVMFIIYFISSIGVFFYKKWSRILYLWSNIIGFVIYVFISRIKLTTKFAGIFDELSTLLIGLTLGLLYFSELKEIFKNPTLINSDGT